MPTDTTPKRCIIYTRLSVERDASTSMERQQQQCEAYAKSHGWEVVDVIRDNGESGSNKGRRLNRPGLAKIRERFRECDVVLIAKLDRLARSVVDFNEFAQEAARHGVALACVENDLNLTTTHGQFVANLLASFAQMEADTIAERTKAGIAGTVAQGRWPGGAPPFGYDIVPHPHGRGVGLAINPGEAALIRIMADSVLGGATIYRTAQDINAAGFRTRGGKEWSVTQVKRVLTNEALCGHQMHRGQVIRTDDGLPEQRWEPIIDTTTLLRLRAAIGPHRQAGPRRKALRVLSGLLRCETCGSALTVGVSTTKVKVYRCSTRSTGKQCSMGVSIPAEPLDQHVVDLVLDLLGDLPVVRIEEVDDDGERVAVEAAIRDTTTEMALPEANLDALTERLRTLHTRRAELDSAPRQATTRIVREGVTFNEMWESSESLDARRDLIAGVISHITVLPGTRRHGEPPQDRITITWSADNNAEEAS